MSSSGPGEITRLLSAWRGGEQEALHQPVPIVHREPRSIADPTDKWPKNDMILGGRNGSGAVE
jgi:hypothetical protein